MPRVKLLNEVIFFTETISPEIIISRDLTIDECAGADGYGSALIARVRTAIGSWEAGEVAFQLVYVCVNAAKFQVIVELFEQKISAVLYIMQMLLYTIFR